MLKIWDIWNTVNSPPNSPQLVPRLHWSALLITDVYDARQCFASSSFNYQQTFVNRLITWHYLANILQYLALHHLLTNGSCAVNGCRQMRVQTADKNIYYCLSHQILTYLFRSGFGLFSLINSVWYVHIYLLISDGIYFSLKKLYMDRGLIF